MPGRSHWRPVPDPAMNGSHQLDVSCVPGSPAPAVGPPRLEEELRSAAAFIESLLPAQGEPVPGIRLAWQYLPSRTLGGDLFNVTSWGPNSLGLYILDASGHGVSAGLRAASLATLLKTDGLPRQIASQDPGEILTVLNRRYPLTHEGHYFTIWVGCLHLRTGQLKFSTAGHAGALVLRCDGRVEPLSRQSLPLGFLPKTCYPTARVTLAAGDRLILFSDGLYEAVSPQGERWGLPRLRKAVQDSGARPLAESLGDLIRQARTWQQRDHFDDDAALVITEVT